MNPTTPRTRVQPKELVVLYDADCPVCRQARRWVQSQHQLVPIRFIPVGSVAARRRFPTLDVGSTLEQITVVTDGGAVVRGERAWTAVLWALARTRPLATQFAHGRGQRRLRGAVDSTEFVRRLAGRRIGRPSAPTGTPWPPPQARADTNCARCHG